jgi:hypothetical protein
VDEGTGCLLIHTVLTVTAEADNLTTLLLLLAAGDMSTDTRLLFLRQTDPSAGRQTSGICTDGVTHLSRHIPTAAIEPLHQTLPITVRQVFRVVDFVCPLTEVRRERLCPDVIHVRILLLCLRILHICRPGRCCRSRGRGRGRDRGRSLRNGNGDGSVDAHSLYPRLIRMDSQTSGATTAGLSK